MKSQKDKFPLEPKVNWWRLPEEVDALSKVVDNLGSNQGPVGPQGIQGPAGPQGDLGPVGPAGLEWQGLWDTDTAYAEDDAVGYDGASWFCILAVTGTGNDTPDVDTTHWALLAAQGAQGQPGATGAQGPEGPQGPAGNVGAKTVGNVTFGFSPINTLSYDINKVPSNGNSDQGIAYLPDPVGLPIGKEVIVACFAATGSSGYFTIQTQDVSGRIIFGNINIGNESAARRVRIAKGEILKFTLIDGGFWILEYLSSEKRSSVLAFLSGAGAISQSTAREINSSKVNAISSGYYSLPMKSINALNDINEVIVYAQNQPVTICTNFSSGGNISSTSNNSYSSAYGMLAYSTVRFTRYYGENWIAEPIIGTFPKFNGIALSASQGYNINEATTNNTTSELSASELNTAYPSSGTISYPIGFKVYCSDITSGALVYIKVNYTGWVSMPITAVV
jgi:hypothetical protein